jgi:hypothetical protein
MSLLDKASLIVTPNAYKESKLYSVVPSSGAGDMDVVRATTATRVNSAGLIEVVPRNIFTYSEQFDNAAWTKANSTVTANATNSPTGILTADKLVENSANDIHFINGSSITFSAGSYSISIFAKASERSVLQIFLNGSANVNAYANFNLTSGVVSAFNDCTATIQSVSDGWYRCVLTTTVVSSTVPSAYYCIQNSTTATRAASYLGNGTSGIFIWGAQLENFATATEYFPTTTRLNIPRIDYTNGSCPSLLVEPQRTNLLTYSNDFTNAIWTKDNVTLTSGVTSPSGINNAFKLVESATTTVHSIYQTFVTLPSSVYSTSIYVKKGERFKVAVADRNTGIYVAFNLNTGTIIASNSLIGKIELLNNDWYRLTVTTSSAITVYVPQFFILEDSYTTGFPILQTYLGNATKGVFISFSQLETGSYPTSYIPTVASTVTRNADVISKTGISSLIGQTEGTIFVDIYIKDTLNQIGVSIQRDGGFNHIFISQFNNKATFSVRAGNSSKLSYSNEPFLNGRNKAALTYNINGTFKVFLNGVKLTQTSISAFTFSNTLSTLQLYDDGYYSSQNITYNNSTQLYKTVLTDAECIALTAL